MKKQFKPFSFLTALILLIVLVLVPTGTFAGASFVKGVFASSTDGNALWEGEGTEAEPYLIQSAEDWDAISASINSGSTKYSGKYFKLTADISVTTVLGNRPNPGSDSQDNVFSGTFDGDGHTLEVHIDEAGFAAPFAVAHNATIQNLKVTGTVHSSSNHASGLVAASRASGAYDPGSLTIRNVTVSVDVSCNSHVAGIVGHAHAADITMENVVFNGSISASSIQGGFIGWGGLSNGIKYSATFKDCLFAGTCRSGAAFHPVAFASGQGTVTLTTDFYTTRSGSGGSPIVPTGSGQIKLVAAAVEKDGAVTFFETFQTASNSANWVAGSTLRLWTDVTTSSTVTVPSGGHTLDLNGHSIKAGSTGYSVVTVGSDADLTILDGSDEGAGRITGGSVGQNYGGVTVDGGTLTLRGGAISGNANTYGGIGNCGGGVYVRNSGKFYMEGGEISGNTSYVGGGVCTDTSATTVSITGGIIKNNKTERFGSAAWAGRNSAAVFRIGGDAEIIDNISTWTADKDGEGTLNFTSALLVSGDPTVHGNWKTSGNSAPNTHINLDNAGNSVQVIELEGALTNDSGTPKITVTPLYRWNDLANGKSFVFTKNWSKYMGDADPADYFVCGNPAYKIFLNSSGEAEVGTPPVAHIINGETSTHYGSFSDAVNAWTAGSTLKLLSDVTTGSTITVPAGEHTLDLNGHGIKMTGSGSVITVGNDATLNVEDSAPTTEHRFTVSDVKSNGAGLATVNDALTSGYKTFTGGYITGGNARNGGGIKVNGTAQLILNGGTIIGNRSSFMGAGIKADNNGSANNLNITVNGGAVMYNTVNGYGAGICSDCTVKINGGTVSYNYATNNPGGVHCHYLYLNGGRIESNYGGQSDYAGGAHADHEVFISGNPVVLGNLINGTPSNLDWDRTEYQHNHMINITGALTEGAKISVTLRNNVTGTFTSGWKDKMSDADPAEYFISDNSGYIVCVTAEGEALLRYPDVPGVSASGVTCDYDGKGHAISVTAPDGATVTYGTQEGDFSLTSSPAFTDAGVYTVYYQVSKTNYTPVTGSATVKIDPISATVTITGHTETADYDGKEHSAAGYDAEASTALFDVTKDFSFSGAAEAKRTDAGKTEMGLAPEQFASANANFAEVTFVVTDGSLTVFTVDAAITAAPRTGSPIYNGSELPLLIPGTADGGTFSYALGADAENAPDAASYQTAIPTAKDLGRYFVWYRVDADHNHNGLPPVCLQVVLAEEGWKTLNGTLYQSDGVTPVAGAAVTLTQGDRTVDAARTDAAGGYQFIVPAGVYNVVASNGASTETTLVKIYEDQDRTLTFSAGSAIAELKVNADGDKHFGVTVDGLTDEALSVRAAEAEDKTVSVLMTVEAKTEETAQNAALINELAGESQNLIFFDTKVEKTVDSVTTVLQTTSNVLELAVPYEKTGKRGVTVYASDGSGVQTLRESDGGEEGTFRIDKENGLIYVYSNRFSTFAIGYTPYYRVESTASLGSFAGTASVVIRSADGSQVFELQNVAPDRISFDDIPKGKYTMTITWEDGAENTLTVPLTIRGKAAASADTANAGAAALAAAKENGVVLAALRRSDADRRSGILTLAAVLTADRADSPDAGAAGSGVSAFSVSPFGTLVGPIPQADPGAALLRLQKLKRVAMRI